MDKNSYNGKLTDKLNIVPSLGILYSQNSSAEQGLYAVKRKSAKEELIESISDVYS